MSGITGATIVVLGMGAASALLPIVFPMGCQQMQIIPNIAAKLAAAQQNEILASGYADNALSASPQPTSCPELASNGKAI